MIVIANDPDLVNLSNRKYGRAFYIFNIPGVLENPEDKQKGKKILDEMISKLDINPTYTGFLEGLPVTSICHYYEPKHGTSRVIIWEQDLNIKGSKRVLEVPWGDNPKND